MIEIPYIKHETRSIKKISMMFNFQYDNESQFSQEIRLIRLVGMKE